MTPEMANAMTDVGLKSIVAINLISWLCIVFVVSLPILFLLDKVWTQYKTDRNLARLVNACEKRKG